MNTHVTLFLPPLSKCLSKVSTRILVPSPVNLLKNITWNRLNISNCIVYSSSHLNSIHSDYNSTSLRVLFRQNSLVIKKSSYFLEPLIESDEEFVNMADNRYLTGYAKLGTSSCKKCKQKIEKGALRIAKLVSNPFSEVRFYSSFSC